MWKVMEKEISKDISQISGLGQWIIYSIINEDKNSAGGVGSK